MKEALEKIYEEIRKDWSIMDQLSPEHQIWKKICSLFGEELPFFQFGTLQVLKEYLRRKAISSGKW
jgi:hypothetical protein